MSELTFYFAVNRNEQGRIFEKKPKRDVKKGVWVGPFHGKLTITISYLVGLGFELPDISWQDSPVKLKLIMNYD